MLNERKQQIIKLIYNQSLDLEQISAMIGVSSRTVRRDLIKISETLGEIGYSVEKNKTVYQVVDEDYTLFENLNVKNSNDLNSEEKIVIAFKPIISGELTIDYKKVADDIYVTPASMKSLICKFLDDYNIRYQLKATRILLELNNIERREVIVAILRDYIRTTDINSIVLEATLDNVKVRNNQIIKDYLDVNLFESLFIKVENIFNDNNKYVTDFQLIMIVLTICVSCKQSQITKLEAISQEPVTNQMLKQIIVESEVTDRNEISYLINKLDSIVTELEYERVSLALISEVSEAISEVETKLGIEFCDRRKLEYQICTHNARMTNQPGDTHLNNNISFTNFVNENKYMFEIIKSVDTFNANDDIKIQYLLIYFVMALEETLTTKQWQIYVICFGGMGTSLMIKKQLEKEYPNSVVQNLSYARALSGAIENADLILSNYKLPNNLQDMVVGHVIKKDDLKQLNSILLSRSSKRKLVRSDERIIFNIGYASNNKECDRATSNVLDNYENSQVITDSKYIFEKLKKRQAVGVGIPDSKIAFFHTRSSSINTLSIATYDVESFTTIGFDGEVMTCNKVLLVLVPIGISDNLLDKVNILSYSLISDSNLITAIEQDNIEKIKQIINE